MEVADKYEVVRFEFGCRENIGIIVDREFQPVGLPVARYLIAFRYAGRILFAAFHKSTPIHPIMVAPDLDVVAAAAKYLDEKARKEARDATTSD